MFLKKQKKKKENRLGKERQWLKSMEIHISYTYRNHLAPTHPPVPSQFSYVLQSPESWVLGPVLIFSLCQSLMTSQCQCMTPQRLIRAAKMRFAQWKIKILHVLHNLGVKKKKKENHCCFEAHSKAVTFYTITSLWNVFSLSTLYFKLNFLCESFDRFLFLNVHANFDTCWNKEKNSQKRLSFRFKRGQSSHSRHAFYYSTKLPRNARGNIIRGKTDTFEK